jgi:single-strand selective monofunctional uracil DNA glycosylase
MTCSFTDSLVERTRTFANQVDDLSFSFSGHIYNPLDYAWDVHEQYLRIFVPFQPDILFLGMNPGPFGMAQTGVPFGEISAVRDWMQLEGTVGKPPHEHPARPVLGFSVQRSEVSGKRLWALMEHRFGTAHKFFARHAVMNYCPLVFVDAGSTGKNVVPERLRKEERVALESCCDSYLDDVITLLQPQALVGVGKFALKRLARSADRLGLSVPVSSILHPSPGNPQANRGWAEQVTAQLEEARLW